MSFTLMHLIEAIVLILNAICVLHEERFMKRMGWGANAQVQGFGEQPTVTAKLLNLVRSIRTVVRGKCNTCQNTIPPLVDLCVLIQIFPLILFNSVLIAFKLVLG
ncbi:hypothetical protein FOCC_FOCC005669 [Frankliniella occidentalis]|nr:hypothetical protein FOCC_FOCC005669 [Frankliniella occidentalis]